MTLIEVAQNSNNELSKTEEHILLYIDTNYHEFANFNITTIATSCNSSTTSINRLIKKLNFENFAEFKFFMQSRRDNTVPKIMDERSEIELHIFNFFQNFDFSQIDELLEAIYNASTCIVIGVGQSSYLVRYFTENLNRFGISAFAVKESHIINSLHPIIKNDAIVIFISSSGNTKTLINAAKLLETKGITMYSLTTNKNNNIQKYVKKSYNLSTSSINYLDYQIHAQSVLFILIDIIVQKYFKLYINKKRT